MRTTYSVTVKLLGRRKLGDFGTKHAQARGPISAWVAEVEAAQWKTMQDVKARYPTASILPGKRIIFNAGANKYRLETAIAFRTATVLVLRIGTHAEYNRWK